MIRMRRWSGCGGRVDIKTPLLLSPHGTVGSCLTVKRESSRVLCVADIHELSMHVCVGAHTALSQRARLPDVSV